MYMIHLYYLMNKPGSNQHVFKHLLNLAMFFKYNLFDYCFIFFYVKYFSEWQILESGLNKLLWLFYRLKKNCSIETFVNMLSIIVAELLLIRIGL